MALALYEGCQKIKAPAYVRDQVNRASLVLVHLREMAPDKEGVMKSEKRRLMQQPLGRGLKYMISLYYI